jgi:carboxyl-terminal processing protease
VNEAGEENVTKSDAVCIQVPMAVLVNADSYSAAEFFAAALKEYNWATVVGEQTTGKGRSQITVELPDGSAVHISNNKYLTPLRVDLSEQGGLFPDVPVVMTSEGDAQLDAAIAAVVG